MHSKTKQEMAAWKWLWFVNGNAFGITLFVSEVLKIALESLGAEGFT
jgi:hypothetical protein